MILVDPLTSFTLTSPKLLTPCLIPKLLHKLKSYNILGKLFDWISAWLTGKNPICKNSTTSFPPSNQFSVVFYKVLYSARCYFYSLSMIYVTLSLLMFTLHSSPMISNFSLTKFPFLLSFCLSMCIHRFSKIPWTNYSRGLNCGSSPFLYLNVLFFLFPILKSPKPRIYSLGTINLPRVKSCSDLGIIIDDKLTFSCHILSSTKKAYKQSIIMSRCFLSKNPHLLKSAFTSYVRPILEYASPIWSPHSLRTLMLLRESNAALPNLSPIFDHFLILLA